MKTEIHAFCSDFAEKLAPFSSSLDKTLAALSEKSDYEPLKGSALSLQEVRQRLSSLEGKVQEQQAYLLIFGPLKSGKSTLMNAISGSYVSEVSSLPAYPALVYVKDGQDRKFEATAYDGTVKSFSDSEAMSTNVEIAHKELARKILEVERDGEVFDPQRHFPEAIRRMDVELPADNLANSGSVLVDTPGLYSRMRFGYDIMTRDFRDTAACAIFVVKSDNLFFEKVFEEFNELLGSFSRIFLVANIDTSKKDLNPDGTLRPSLESHSPNEIIKAFQSLSMSAPLREAFESGRLNVYPIDLLKAASRRLSGEEVGVDEASDGFEDFLNDLTDYLNSSDYLQEFMFDSLRMGSDLGQEANRIVLEQAVKNLKTVSSQLSERLESIKVKRGSLDTVSQIDWAACFDSVYAEKDRLLQEMSEKNALKLSEKLVTAIDEWMETDESLKDLQDKRLVPILESETADDTKILVEQLRQLLDTPQGGARLSSDQQRAIQRVELDIGQIIPRLLTTLEEGVSQKPAQFEIDAEAISVKRGFWDVLLFRSADKIRRSMFGPELDQPVPVKIKAKRLRGEGLERMKEKVAEVPSGLLPRRQKDHLTQLLDGYVSRFAETVKRQLGSLKDRLNQRTSEVQGRLSAVEELKAVCHELRDASESFGESISVLRGRYKAEPVLKITNSGEPLAPDEMDFETRKEAVDAQIHDVAENLQDRDDDIEPTDVSFQTTLRYGDSAVPSPGVMGQASPSPSAESRLQER